MCFFPVSAIFDRNSCNPRILMFWIVLVMSTPNIIWNHGQTVWVVHLQDLRVHILQPYKCWCSYNLSRWARCFLPEIGTYTSKWLPATNSCCCHLRSSCGVRWQSHLVRTCTRSFRCNCCGNGHYHCHQGCLGLFSQRGALRRRLYH